MYASACYTCLPVFVGPGQVQKPRIMRYFFMDHTAHVIIYVLVQSYFHGRCPHGLFLTQKKVWGDLNSSLSWYEVILANTQFNVTGSFTAFFEVLFVLGGFGWAEETTTDSSTGLIWFLLPYMIATEMVQTSQSGVFALHKSNKLCVLGCISTNKDTEEAAL